MISVPSGIYLRVGLLERIVVVLGASLVAQMVKNLPEMQETSVQFLGWEDSLEKDMATHSSTLAWKIPRTDGGAWWATVHWVSKSWTQLCDFTYLL